MAYLKPQSPLEKEGDYFYPLTTVDQVIMEDGTRLNAKLDDGSILVEGSVTAAKLADDAKALVFEVTLSAGSWSNNSQTVSNGYFLASGYKYDVAPAPSSFLAYAESAIFANDVLTDGIMTFTCQDVPKSNLTVYISRVVTT